MANVNFVMLSISVKDNSFCLNIRNRACFSSSFCHYTFSLCFMSRFFHPVLLCLYVQLYLGRTKCSRWHYTIFYHAHAELWSSWFLHVLDWDPRILKLIIKATSCKIYQAISTTCQIYIEQNCKTFSFEDLRCKIQHTEYWNLWSWRALFQKETMLAQQSEMRLVLAITL